MKNFILKNIPRILCFLIVLAVIVFVLDLVFFNGTFAKKGRLDLWDWFAIIIASASLYYTVLTWQSQNQTMKNTTRLNTNDFRDMLIDSFYNIIRNTIRLYSLSETLKNKYSLAYPSEEYLLKTKIHIFDTKRISQQNIPKHYYGLFRRLSELCEYFNIHLDAAQKHLASAAIGQDIKERDIKTLIKLHWLLAEEIFKTINFICPNEKNKNKELILREFIERAEHLYLNLRTETTETEADFIDDEGIRVLNILLGESDCGRIIATLNKTIKSHLSKRNSVPLIPLRP